MDFPFSFLKLTIMTSRKEILLVRINDLLKKKSAVGGELFAFSNKGLISIIKKVN